MRRRKSATEAESPPARKRTRKRSSLSALRDKTKTGTRRKAPSKAATSEDSISIDSFAATSLKQYGSYVVEERSITDFRDGLKPVHRYILWAMKNLGLNSKSKYKKSARTIGDVLGKYHPHGDQAAYGAMATLVNYKLSPQLVDGQGNWGTPVDNQAAMRYTEARLSAMSDIFLLDKGYLKTVPMVDNFDNSEKVPLYLPATLPMLLVLGSSGIGFGVKSDSPPFNIDGVYELVLLGLKAFKANKKLGPNNCAKHLRIDYSYGGVQVSEDEDVANLIKYGKGSIKFAPEVNADWKNKLIEIKSFSPGFRSSNVIQKKLAKFAEMDAVSKAGDDSNEKNPKSGPLGAYFYIKPARGISEEKFFDLAEQVFKELVSSESYDLGFTVRRADDSNMFVKSSFVSFFNNWIKYRVQLEIDYLQALIDECLAQIDRTELLIFGVDNRQLIIKSLDSKDPDKFLISKLKISAEKAKALLDLQVRKLAKLEKPALLQKIKELKAEIRQYKQDQEDPTPRIATKTKEQFKAYKSRVK